MGTLSNANIGTALDNNQNYNGERRIVRTSLGVMWFNVYRNTGGTRWEFYYSTDDGATWTEDTGAELVQTEMPNNQIDFAAIVAMFVDADDNVWLAAQGQSTSYDQYVYHRVGTLNGAHTAITWASVGGTNNDGWFEINTGRGSDVDRRARRDMVVTKHGTDDYRVHFVYCPGGPSVSNTCQIAYSRVRMQLSGSPATQTIEVTYDVVETMNDTNDWGSPTIDFHHTGDGVTTKDSLPHIFLFWKGPANGSPASQPSFMKIAATGASTWNTVASSTVRRLKAQATRQGIANIGRFDGTRCVAVFNDADGTSPSNPPVVVERDAADTTSTDRTPSGTIAVNINGIGAFIDGSTGDITLWVHDNANDMQYNRYDRSVGTWSGWTTAYRTDVLNSFYGATPGGLSRGSVAARAYLSTTTGTITAITESFNSDPTAPGIDLPADGSTADVAETLLIDWTFNDPDTGDTQSAYTLRRQVNAGSLEYWDGATWAASESASTKIATSTTQQTLAASWGTDGDSHSYSIKTWDAADAGPSAWSTAVTITASAQDNPSLTAPTDTGTVTGATDTVSWTVTTQTAYRVVVSDTSSTSNMDAGSLEYDSGWTISASTSVVADFPTNGVTRYVRVKTKNNHGLESDIDQHSVTVTYTPPTPATPVVTAVAGQWIEIEIDDTSASTDIASYEIYRRVVGDTSVGILLRGASGIPEGDNLSPFYTWTDYTVASGVNYEYRIKAIGDNGSAAFSSWVS